MATPQGSPNTNSTPNAIYTKAYLMQWIMQSTDNAIGYAAQYSPIAVYNYIQTNWPNQFPHYKSGMENTGPVIDSMDSFLKRQCADLSQQQQQAFIKSLYQALPPTGLNNWTQPID